MHAESRAHLDLVESYLQTVRPDVQLHGLALLLLNVRLTAQLENS